MLCPFSSPGIITYQFVDGNHAEDHLPSSSGVHFGGF
jgi:hypothetical protein